MTVEVQAQMQRLETARKRVREVDGKKTRLGALIEERERRVTELEEQAQNDFECDMAELPDMVKQLKQESEDAVKEAESILGLAEPEEEGDPDGCLLG
jgi:DNA repair exonuclease SbcCD ATPase subunit